MCSSRVHQEYKCIEENYNIEKPILDDREYRLLELSSNQLNVLVIHDPTTDKAAASLDVNVGSFADKIYGVLGLAHFCEHLLFMGTEKYPLENEYSSYLARHNGASNAYTALENTNYYFSLDAGYLEGALDRFAQFFIAPLFSVGCADREINAVDSESKKNLQDDTWRLYQLDKSTSNPEHPFNGFSTGNIQTLTEDPSRCGINVRNILIDFHKQQYSSNIMTLVILGKEDLDTLSKWASSMFSDIANKHLSRPNYHGTAIFSTNELQKLIRAKPVKYNHKLKVTFQIPDDLETHWLSQPSNYYSHLLGHEGEGSLLHYVKQCGWATELCAGHYMVCQGTSFFSIDFDLTPKGLRNWEEIVQAMFQYIRMIHSTSPQKWIWKEIGEIQQIAFNFKQKSEPANTVSGISKYLHKFISGAKIPSRRLLSYNVSREYNPDEISRIGMFLVPENMRITLVSPLFDALDQVEKWYDTEYSIGPFPEKIRILPAWISVTDGTMHLPKPNPFIPREFKILGSKALKPRILPYLIRDTNHLQLWYKGDDQFMVPKGSVQIILHMPSSNTDVFSSTCTALIAKFVDDSLTELIYYAALVDSCVQIAPWRDGIDFKFSGYSDKMTDLCLTVLDRFLSFEPREKGFDELKYKLTQEYRNFGMAAPFRQIQTHFMTLVNEKTYLYPDRVKVLDALTFEKFRDFVVTRMYAAGIFAESLVIGNFDYGMARKFADSVENCLFKFCLVADTSTEIRKVISLKNHILEPNEYARFEMTLQDSKNLNSCIFFNIQIAPDQSSMRIRVLTDLLCTIVKEPAFDQLRTKEQLGYVVFSGLNYGRSSLGYRIIVQSERSTDYLEYRIEEFLQRFGKVLRTLFRQDEFETFKRALTNEKLLKLRNLQEEFGQLNSAITRGFFDFESRQEHVQVLKDINMEEFTEFYEKYILNHSGLSARFVLHLKSQCCPPVELQSLVMTSIQDFMFQNSIVTDMERLEAIIMDNYNDLTRLVNQMAKEMRLVLSELLEKELLARLVQDISQPMPERYPNAKIYRNVVQVNRELTLGAAPEPVRPLSDFYYPDAPCHL